MLASATRFQQKMGASPALARPAISNRNFKQLEEPGFTGPTSEFAVPNARPHATRRAESTTAGSGRPEPGLESGAGLRGRPLPQPRGPSCELPGKRLLDRSLTARESRHRRRRAGAAGRHQARRVWRSRGHRQGRGLLEEPAALVAMMSGFNRGQRLFSVTVGRGEVAAHADRVPGSILVLAVAKGLGERRVHRG